MQRKLGKEGVSMDKNEILEKARQGNAGRPDEMQRQILDRGGRTAFAVGLAVCVVLMVVKIMADQPFTDVYAVYCSMMAAVYLYQWYKVREWEDMVYGLLWGVVALVLLIASIAMV